MKTNRGFIPILAIIIVAVIAVGGGYWVYQEVGGDVDFNLPPIELSNDEGDFVTPKPFTSTEPIACTMEAKICPDGSAVGRTGPKCEFAACPAVNTEQLIRVDNPKPNSRVDVNKPLVISGQARKVFNEGEFDITASYLLGSKPQAFTRAMASCNLTGDGCEWFSGNFVEFRASMDLKTSPACFITLDFYPRVAKDGEVAKSVYTLPIWLYGNANCQ